MKDTRYSRTHSTGVEGLTEEFFLNIIPDMKQDRVTLKIPRPLYDQLKSVIQTSGFRSVNEFVIYILRDLVALKNRPDNQNLSQEEVEAIRQRLKNLGYF